MQIENSQKKTNKRSRPDQQQPKQAPNKDLLRLERDIFELKKSEQNQSEYVIRKLMQKKQKPQISMIQKSPLLSRLQEMMPIFKKSNQELQQREISQSQKIDVRLEECESSSSSSQSENEGQEFSETNQTQHLKNKINKMDLEVKQKHPFHSEMQNEQQEQSENLIEINFLRYPYLNQQQLNQLQAQQLQKQNKKEQLQNESRKQKKILIEEISPQPN